MDEECRRQVAISGVDVGDVAPVETGRALGNRVAGASGGVCGGCM